MVTQEAGFGARMLGWIRQTYCGLHGHDTLMHFEKDRMSLQCASCGHETTGWALTERRPMVTVRAETRVAFRRPRLVSARRIA
jgi:hypothetical protein